MKYTIITKDYRRSIEATTLSQDDTFIILKSKKNTWMIAKETVLSIFTENFEPVEVQKKVETRKEHNDRIIQLYRGQK